MLSSPTYLEEKLRGKIVDLREIKRSGYGLVTEKLFRIFYRLQQKVVI
jgi:hypothetical protein